jgi:hypothetical protein
MLTTLKVLKFNWIEEQRVRRSLYPQSSHFEKYDRELKRRFRFLNPYTLCRRYLQKKGEANVHAYGETPLTLLEAIVKRFYIGKEETLVEMGAGRGRGALFLASAMGLHVKALEQHPLFCQILREMKVEGLEVVEGDMMEADLSEATSIYLYGTMLTDSEIQALIAEFKKMSPAVKIITVSYPLRQYDSTFEIVDQFEGEFPWGKTTVFFNRRSSE